MTAGNPHVGNELFGLLDGGGQPALQRVGASGSGTIQSSSPEQPLHQKAANERFRVNKGLACRRRVEEFRILVARDLRCAEK